MSDTGARYTGPPGLPGGGPGTRSMPTSGRTPSPAQTTRPDDLTLGELLGRMTSDLSTLFRQEVALAKVELKGEATKAAKGAGMFGGAGSTAYMAVLLLSFAAVWGLAEVMATGFAFLVIGGLYALVAAALFASGRKKLRSVHGPQQTVETVKEDAQWARDLKN